VNPADARREQRLHRFFEITLLLKALFAVGEIVAAIGVYLAPLDRVADFVGAITQAELTAHPERITDILCAGAERCRARARETMTEVRERMGLR